MRNYNYPSVPEELKEMQSFLIDELKNSFYKKQSIKNIGLGLIVFFSKQKQAYKAIVTDNGKEENVEVYVRVCGEKITLLTINESKDDNSN